MLLPTCDHPQGSGSGGSKGVRETVALGVATWHLQCGPSSPLPITQKPLGRAALRDAGARVTRDRRPGVHQPQPPLHIRQLTCDRWQPSPAPPHPIGPAGGPVPGLWGPLLLSEWTINFLLETQHTSQVIRQTACGWERLTMC